VQAKVITLSGNKDSFTQANVLIDSSNHFRNDFTISKYLASEPDDVVTGFIKHKIKWNYPWTKTILDIQSGLLKRPYETADPKKRMACFLSHYMLWYMCFQSEEPYLIFEHDAKFIKKVDIDMIDQSDYQVVSLNDPRGATRKSSVYHELISKNVLSSVPWIDDQSVPQGLPGNSAYYLKPKGAKKLLDLVNEYGAWPNDALMCKQLMPKMLGCLGDYATIVQQTNVSTTTK
jgi:hypothetical protein